MSLDQWLKSVFQTKLPKHGCNFLTKWPKQEFKNLKSSLDRNIMNRSKCCAINFTQPFSSLN